jgi:hypothetical protein
VALTAWASVSNFCCSGVDCPTTAARVTCCFTWRANASAGSASVSTLGASSEAACLASIAAIRFSMSAWRNTSGCRPSRSSFWYFDAVWPLTTSEKSSSLLATIMMSRTMAAAIVAERPMVVAEAPMIWPVTGSALQLPMPPHGARDA